MKYVKYVERTGVKTKLTTKEIRMKIKDILTDSRNKITEESFIEALIDIISLPDDDFRVTSKLVLESVHRYYSDYNNKLELINVFNSSNTTVEAFNEQCKNAIEELKNESKEGNLPQDRIDFLITYILLILEVVNNIEEMPKRVVPIKVIRKNKDIRLPEYAHKGDSGMDVFSPENYEIMPGEVKIIPTGLKMEIPFGYELQVRPRSGNSLKTKLRVANTPGTIDSNFRGEIGILVENIDQEIKDVQLDEKGQLVIGRGSPIVIDKGMKIAQLVLQITLLLYYKK